MNVQIGILNKNFKIIKVFFYNFVNEEYVDVY